MSFTHSGATQKVDGMLRHQRILCFGFDGRFPPDYAFLYTASFRDPLVDNTYRQGRIDHNIYSRNPEGWMGKGNIWLDTVEGRSYSEYPLSIQLGPFPRDM